MPLTGRCRFLERPSASDERVPFLDGRLPPQGLAGVSRCQWGLCPLRSSSVSRGVSPAAIESSENMLMRNSASRKVLSRGL